jgi:hypothetical protein
MKSKPTYKLNRQAALWICLQYKSQLTDWEKSFIQSIRNLHMDRLSRSQSSILMQLGHRLLAYSTKLDPRRKDRQPTVAETAMEDKISS